jgi:hypothetical protein
MAKSIIRIPKDPKHKITIPTEVWELEKLKFGDYVEIEIKKAKEAT